VTYRIVLTQVAAEHLKSLDARRRSKVQKALVTHLTHEPTKQSKGRIKKLRDLRHPQFRLRVDDIRVFYDIEGDDVVIVARMSKERSSQWLEEHGEE